MATRLLAALEDEEDALCELASDALALELLVAV